eukprot:2643953-Amphidinium_carterae.1
MRQCRTKLRGRGTQERSHPPTLIISTMHGNHRGPRLRKQHGTRPNGRPMPRVITGRRAKWRPIDDGKRSRINEAANTVHMAEVE